MPGVREVQDPAGIYERYIGPCTYNYTCWWAEIKPSAETKRAPRTAPCAHATADLEDLRHQPGPPSSAPGAIDKDLDRLDDIAATAAS